MVKEYFGHDLVNKTEVMLEAYYNKDITNLRQYFSLVDARVAEYYQTEHPDLRLLQR